MLSEQSKARYKRFWNREDTDRCVMYITAPKENPAPKYGYMQPKDLKDQWTNKILIHNNMMHYTENVVFPGDGFGRLFINTGPGCLAACVGGSYLLMPDTVWFDRKRIICDWKDYTKLKLDKNSEMCRLVDDLTEYSLKNSNGKFYTSVSDIGGNLDILASLRGNHFLLLDTYDFPEEIKKASEDIDEAWLEFFNHNIKDMPKYQDGYTGWIPIWSDKKWAPLQCDFSAMISSEMFREFVVPSLKRQTKYLENSVYHLDGPGAAHHLDALLEIEDLDAIQWTPGEGALPVGNVAWFPMYKKIQAKGKALVLLGLAAHDVKNVLSNISSKGLYIDTIAPSAEDAEDLIKIAEDLAFN